MHFVGIVYIDSLSIAIENEQSLCRHDILGIRQV